MKFKQYLNENFGLYDAIQKYDWLGLASNNLKARVTFDRRYDGFDFTMYFSLVQNEIQLTDVHCNGETVHKFIRENNLQKEFVDFLKNIRQKYFNNLKYDISVSRTAYIPYLKEANEQEKGKASKYHRQINFAE